MKKSLKKFSKVETFREHKILVYGELWEEGYVDGLVIQRAKFSRDGRKVMDISMDHEDILLNRPYIRTRYFNMGWAICSPEDKFDETVGIELCKKRFRKSPLKTETGLFLTKDMVNALIENEVNYIKKNWAKFAPKTLLPGEAEIMSAANKVVNVIKNVKKKEDDFDFWKVKKEEPTLYIEDSLTEEEKLMRKPPMFNVEETIEVLKEATDECPVDTGVEAGSYVRVLSKTNQKIPFTVAYVKNVDDNGVDCLWLIKYGDNFSSFRINNTYLPKSRYFVRLATEKEVSDALKAIEEKTSFHWNVSEKRLEAKYV